MYPSDFAAAPAPVRLTLLAALCHVRQTEITDALVELLIQLVQKINTRAERKVESELNAELRRVRGKEASCSGSPRPRWSTRTTRCARRCTRWSARRTLQDLVGGGQGEREGVTSPGAHGAARLVLDHYRRMLPSCCGR